MKNPPRRAFSFCRLTPPRTLAAFGAAWALALIPGARAATGTWTNTSGGAWDTASNWSNSQVADGYGNAALFNTLSLTAPTVVDLDSSHTIGSLSFGGGNSTNTWTLSSANNSVLTLAGSTTPTITAGSDTIISTVLNGKQGLTKSGAGSLIFLTGSTLPASSFGGTVTVSSGALNVRASSNNGVFTSQLNNAAVTLAGGSFTIGTSSGAGAAIGGLNSDLGTGSVTAAASQILYIRGVSGDYSYGGTMNRGALVVALGGGGSQTLQQNLAYTGYTTVISGKLISTTSATTGNPFSTGGVRLGTSSGNTTGGGNGAGALVINSGATTGAAVALTGANSAAGTTFAYNNGSQLILNKGAAASLSYTVGNASATANSVLVRVGAAAATPTPNSEMGTLIITPESGLANFGTASGEKFIVNGGVATNATNGMVSASIIGKDSDASHTGSFLTYDATNGFKTATYSASTDINGGTAFSDTRVFDAATNQTLSGAAAVYALRVQSGVTVALGSNSLSIGESTAGSASGIILNDGSITGGNLYFAPDAAGVIYVSGTSTISSSIHNVASGVPGRGVTVMGPGELILGGTNDFRGGLWVADSTISVSNNNQLGLANASAGAGNVNLRGGTFKVTDNMTVTNRTFGLEAGVSSGGGTFDVASGKSLVITNGANNGKLIGGGGSLTKAGTGSMTLGGTLANTYTGKTTVSAGTLILSATAAGTTMIASTGSTGVDAFATDVQVNSTGTLQWNQSNQIVDTAKLALSGGTLNLNGQSEGSTSAAGLGNFSLSATSTIDFGLNDNGNIIRFAGLDTHTALTTLNIINWNGSANTGGGSERLLFSGLASDFTGLFSQDDVSFNGQSGYSAVQFGDYYEVAAVPEPGTIALIGVAGLALMVIRRRARMSAR